MPAKPGAMPAKPGAMPAKPGAMPAKPGAMPAKPGAMPAKPGAVLAKPGAGAVKPGGKPARKSGRKGTAIRRGPSGEILAVGEILLPGGTQHPEEVQYLLRGSIAAEHAAGEAGIEEVLSKRPAATDSERNELSRQMNVLAHRFGGGHIEPMLPSRPNLPRRTFQTVVDRAKLRRREIGAFLRGLDIGRTETSHMDSHGEASLQALMEWAARLENLTEADEPEQADYAQFHRGLDQLENTTEALIVDVEATLRRLRDRPR
jgi:hypothetical protein